MYDENDSIILKASSDLCLEEKCVVSQFRTTSEQLQIFKEHLTTCDNTRVPIEWVIDIADESNGWFYGTAYHFDDSNQKLHIMVPDKENPNYDGEIQLDYRMVHLVECTDGRTEALFNKIVRDSIVKVKWEVEWFEEGTGDTKFDPDNNMMGKWIPSIARYFLRIPNQLLVEDVGGGPSGAHGFVMLTADMSLKLKQCIGDRGIEDFNRLVIDGRVQCSRETMESTIVSANKFRTQEVTEGNTPLKRLSDMSRSLRESITVLLEEREKMQSDHKKMISAFTNFTLHGDLDAAMSLMNLVDESKTPMQQQMMDEWEVASEDTWYLCQKVEKSILKLIKAGDTSASADEVDTLKRQLRALRKDLDKK
jgi:hypothetical protein